MNYFGGKYKQRKREQMSCCINWEGWVEEQEVVRVVIDKNEG